MRLALFFAIVVAGAIAGFVTGSGEDTATRRVLEKWLRLSEQHAPIFKWTAGGLQTVQSCPRRRSVDATTAFFGELAETRALDGYKTLWPKGLQVAKDNAERVVAASQELFGLSLKTGEAFGQLVKTQFETATDNVQASVAKATKAAKGK